MQKRKNNIIILDTETVGSFDSPMIHDIGYIIMDKNGDTLIERRYLVAETRAINELLYKSDFYQSKAQKYLDDIASGKVEVLPWDEIRQILFHDLRTYKVKAVGAYNLAFDYRSIKNTDTIFNNMKESQIIKKFDRLDLICLWGLSVDTIGQTEAYRQYCKDNRAISKKGNLLTNAETMYRYAINPDFIEEHTALADAKIEAELYTHIIKNYKGKIIKGLQYNAWKRAQLCAAS